MFELFLTRITSIKPFEIMKQFSVFQFILQILILLQISSKSISHCKNNKI